MRGIVLVSLAAAALSGGVTAYAQEHMDHRQHMATVSDERQLVSFPPEMRQCTLANMRDHLQALSEILNAMSDAQYTKAAETADARLGMNSPSAAGCKAEDAAAPKMSKPDSMDHRMSQFMPEAMRKIGLEMHESASAFAAEAAKASKTSNDKPALAALSRVTQQCTACHATYRLQ